MASSTWPGEKKAHPLAHGRSRYAALLRARPLARHGSRWAAFSHRSCRRSVGFCDPRLAFSKLNGYSNPAGIWLYESQGRLVMNQSSGNPAGVPFGQPWAVRANVSATIVGGDHSASVLEFALDGMPHDCRWNLLRCVFQRCKRRSCGQGWSRATRSCLSRCRRRGACSAALRCAATGPC